MQKKYCSILFDFDYTLADSSKGVIECVNYALCHMGYAAADPQLICKTIGLSLKDTFIRLVGKENSVRSPEFAKIFTMRADEIMAEFTLVYPYIPNTFKRLTDKNLRLGIVSTKYRYRIMNILEREKLHGFIDVIIGGEDVAQHKPDPTGLLTAINRLHNSINEVLYIGDSQVDAETAKRGGVAFAAVLSGMSGKEEFTAYPVINIFTDLVRMTDWLLQ